MSRVFQAFVTSLSLGGFLLAMRPEHLDVSNALLMPPPVTVASQSIVPIRDCVTCCCTACDWGQQKGTPIPSIPNKSWSFQGASQMVPVWADPDGTMAIKALCLPGQARRSDFIFRRMLLKSSSRNSLVDE
jgi:hypothetical protein